MSKAEVKKFKEAVVKYKDDGEEDEIRVRESPGGGYIISDFTSGETPYSIRLTKKQWKAIKKAVKALKGKKHRVKEEPDAASATPDEQREPT